MKVLARVKLLSSADGGRTQPMIGNFRPNHSFQPDTFVVGEVQQERGSSLFPGQSADLVVQFIPEGVPELTPGLEWKIYDGPRHLIGSATVLKLIDG
jgi:elongation factor Tu